MDDNRFWEWSVRVYARPDVQKPCMKLQDQFSQDVNMVLWACWLGSLGKSPTDAALLALEDIFKNWQNGLISGVRKARRSISENSHLSHAPDLKSAFLNLELSLEKQEQMVLQALPMQDGVKPCNGADELSCHNLKAIIQALNLGHQHSLSEWKDTVGDLLTAIF